MDFPTTQVGQYIWQDNGQGGVNYFKVYDTGTSSIKQPISREQYASGTAASGTPQDPGAIENWVTQNHQNANNKPEGDTPTTQTNTTSGSTNGFKSLNGQVYNLDDPTQRSAFLTARNSQYESQLAQTNSELDQNMNSDLASAGRTFQDKYNLFNKNQSDLNSQLDEYNTGNDQYSKDLYNLYEGFGQGNVARQNYFTRLSPDTYQHSQGTSANYANNMYQKGVGEENTARGKYFGDLNYNIATNKQGLSDLGSDYNSYLDNARNYYASQKNQNNTTYNQGKDSLNQDSITLNNNKYNGFNYNGTPQGTVTANQVDLSAYTPYTNFQALGSSPRANLFSKFTPATSTLTPLEQTLGYSPKTKDTNSLNSYLYK